MKYDFEFKQQKLSFKDLKELTEYAHKFNEYFKALIFNTLDEKGKSPELEYLQKLMVKE